MLKIKNIEFKNNLFAAPLAGFTNKAYRIFLKEFPVATVVSEMISDCALMYNNQETINMLDVENEPHPIVLQIFGGKKETLISGIKILEAKANYDILDINLGCPVNKVVKGNAGSAWLKKGRENELYETMKTIVEISSKPVSAKIRIGWDQNSINCVEIAKILEKAGVQLLFVHGRTRKALYSGSCNYEMIKKVKEAVKIPVIANGDIDSPIKAKEVLDYTKADGLMIGRASLGNPYLFTRIDKYLNEGLLINEATLNMQIGYVIKHYEMLKQLKGEFKATREMRSIAPRYFKGFNNTKDYRISFTKISSSSDFYKIIDEIKLANNLE